MDKQQILRAFNDHFIELVDDIVRVFPNNTDIKTLRTAFIRIRKANPRLILKTIKSSVLAVYREQIEEGNLDFFIEKDYTSDFNNIKNGKNIISKINQLRDCVREMNDEDKKTIVKYFHNLLKLSDLYYK